MSDKAVVVEVDGSVREVQVDIVKLGAVLGGVPDHTVEGSAISHIDYRGYSALAVFCANRGPVNRKATDVYKKDELHGPVLFVDNRKPLTADEFEKIWVHAMGIDYAKWQSELLAKLKAKYKK